MIKKINDNISSASSESIDMFRSNFKLYKSELLSCNNIYQILNLINKMKEDIKEKGDEKYFLNIFNAMKILCDDYEKINKKINEIKNEYLSELYINKFIYKNIDKDDDLYKGGGSKCKLNKTDDKIKIIYNKKQYERTIYIY